MAVIRKGTSDDLNGALKLIRELAEYEKAPEAVENTVQRMHEDGFGDKPVFEFFVAEELVSPQGAKHFLEIRIQFLQRVIHLTRTDQHQLHGQRDDLRIQRNGGQSAHVGPG